MPNSSPTTTTTRKIPYLKISIAELGSLLIGNGLIFVLFYILKGQVYFDVIETQRTFIRFEDPSFIVGLLSILFGVALTSGERVQRHALTASAAVALILGVTTSILIENYSILRGPWIKGVIGLGIILAAAFSPKKTLTVAMLIGFPLYIVSFLNTLGGHTINSDDHASFIFRLSMLKEHFPNIPFYYPGWNAGLDARDFFATGALNVFFLFFPLIMTSDVTSVYSFILSVILFILLPLSTFFGARAFGLHRFGSLIAATLAVSSNLFWYRWALKYGPVGFITAASLLPFIYGYGWKIFFGQNLPTIKEKVLFIFATCLALCWAPSSIALSPLILTGVGAFILNKEKRSTLLRIALAIGLIMAPFALMVTAVSNPAKFLRAEKNVAITKNQLSLSATDHIAAASTTQNGIIRAKKKEITYERIERNLRDGFVGWNYALMVLAFAGIILFKERSIRRLYYIAVLLLVTLGAAISIAKPQLELDRMIVLLGLLLSIPAAHAAQEILSWWRNKTSIVERGCALLTAGFIFASITSVGLVVKNRTLERFYIRSRDTESFISSLKNLPGSGRIFFSGCILHELDGGHFAPLSLATGKDLVGSAPFHTLWWYTPSIPEEVTKNGEKAISDFINLYNTQYVIAHEPTWINFFDKHPVTYKHLHQVGKFVIYEKLDFADSYIYSGSATKIDRAEDRITLIPTSSSLTLKFRYFPFLRSTSCTLSPESVRSDLSFIHLEGCTPGDEVTIESVSPLQRIEQELFHKKL